MVRAEGGRRGRQKEGNSWKKKKREEEEKKVVTSRFLCLQGKGHSDLQTSV